MLVIILGGVAVAVTVKPSDSSSASSSLCRDTSRCLLPPPVYLFCPFLPSPCLSLSRFPSPFSTTSSSLFFLPPFGSLFIRVGERGRPCLVPSQPMHGAHVACSATALTAVANGGVACGARLLWHLIMRWVASDFGSKACGRKRQG